MTTPTNPVLHVPAHKQTNPAAKPGQIVNRTDGMHPALGASYGTTTGRMVSSTPNVQQIPLHTPEAARIRNVWVHAVQQDKEQAK